MKNNFKPGDIVTLKIPTGKQLIPGSYNRTGFQGGLVYDMIDFLNSRKKYKVENSIGRYIKLEGDRGFHYDYTWFEKIEEDRNEVINVKFIKNKKETLAIINDTKIGKTVKSASDRNNDNIGIIVSLLRALKIDKDTENKIIDVLFEEEEESKKIDLSEVSKEELLEEIAKRMW